ncbi:hypothetical protein [Lascolabacillus sp.]|jgi:hypothetical protein|uniref:hypothetical protein n=1 Tax=Bacteroidales TaxID=171549 RepID=UPI00258BD4C6|nr:hypothetical protein [Lascolabacillus sp.]MDD2287973.1 hypothetical protein [Bacteroidales bacterium]MDD4759144.1 hypothetical protein [Lascolabacillus sp.]
MPENIIQTDNSFITNLANVFYTYFPFVALAIMTLLYRSIQTRIKQSGQHGYDKKIEEIRGEITKNNETLNAVVQSYFTSSEKLLDKKVEACSTLWQSTLNIRDMFPSDLYLIYQIYTNEELESPDMFDLINHAPLTNGLSRYNIDNTVKPILNVSKSLSSHKPYLNDTSYRLFSVLQGATARILDQFISHYEISKIYNWRKDKALVNLLNIALKDDVLKYIIELNLASLRAVMDTIEYEILQEIRDSLNIKHSTEDTIKYLKEVEQLYNAIDDSVKKKPNIKK